MIPHYLLICIKNIYLNRIVFVSLRQVLIQLKIFLIQITTTWIIVRQIKDILSSFLLYVLWSQRWTAPIRRSLSTWTFIWWWYWLSMVFKLLLNILKRIDSFIWEYFCCMSLIFGIFLLYWNYLLKLFIRNSCAKWCATLPHKILGILCIVFSFQGLFVFRIIL